MALEFVDAGERVGQLSLEGGGERVVVELLACEGVVGLGEGVESASEGTLGGRELVVWADRTGVSSFSGGTGF